MKVICAPDSFKDALSAANAASAMAQGLRDVLPDAEIDFCPVADGGEGTLDAFSTSMAGEQLALSVCGPLGNHLAAAYGRFSGGQLAVIEAALAAGLQLVPLAQRDPAKTTTYGVGQLIMAACQENPRRVLVGIGGSATNDGGCGMAQALGVRFFDEQDALITTPITGAMLRSIGHIDTAERLPELCDIEVVVASDVRNVLTGPDGAAAIYGPQKGASKDQVAALDNGLRHLAELIRCDLGMDIEALPGSGAAGGLGGGLVAFAGASIASGIDTVLKVSEFERRLQGCDLCLTGEGSIDAQSLSGKACMGVARAAARHNVPTIALVGAAGAGAEQCLAAGLDEIVVIGKGLPAEQSMRDTAGLLAKAAADIAQRWTNRG